jgi:3-methyladenine DNA glycosylase AlkD
VDLWNIVRVQQRLKEFSNPKSQDHLIRVKIDTSNSLGTRVLDLRTLAKEIGINHNLALELWASKNRECMLLACIIDDPREISEDQIDSWLLDVNTWELCDCLICNAFEHTSFTFQKAIEWANREEEFIKRAAFVTMARYGLKNRQINLEQVEQFWCLIKQHAIDERNWVKKAVNWALRQLGKKNKNFHQKAIAIAEDLLKLKSKAAHWIAQDALRELRDPKIIQRIK